jgi:hypothetical protein
MGVALWPFSDVYIVNVTVPAVLPLHRPVNQVFGFPVIPAQDLEQAPLVLWGLWGL